MPEPPDTLNTERLRLRRLRASDAALVFETWAQDAEVTRFLTWPPHTSIEESMAHAERCERAWESGESYTWVIEERGTGAPIGSIAAHPAGHRIALGYLLAPGARGRGYMTEAVRALAAWWLAQPGVFRVWAICDVENRASAGVLERAGFTLEGRLRRWIVHPNVSDAPRDVLCFSRARQP